MTTSEVQVGQDGDRVKRCSGLVPRLRALCSWKRLAFEGPPTVRTRCPGHPPPPNPPAASLTMRPQMERRLSTFLDGKGLKDQAVTASAADNIPLAIKLLMIS